MPHFRIAAATYPIFRIPEKEKRDRHHPECPYVFFRNEKQIKDFGMAWDAACKRVGLEGRLFRNLRGTAVRNMVRAEIP
jgi:hypothetical protein